MCPADTQCASSLPAKLKSDYQGQAEQQLQRGGDAMLFVVSRPVILIR
jgi:hypothetical protein